MRCICLFFEKYILLFVLVLMLSHVVCMFVVCVVVCVVMLACLCCACLFVVFSIYTLVLLLYCMIFVVVFWGVVFVAFVLVLV